MRARWLLGSVTADDERVEMAIEGTNYWWFKTVEPWDYACYFPRSAGARTDRRAPPPQFDSTPLTRVMVEQADIYLG